MKFQNPIIPGFYPDPSVCFAKGKFYLVTSTFQYFPGVALFESADLVNWSQIGHVLTRPSQLPLTGAVSSAGIFAPTIRYNNGTFYMVTTNTTTGRNFYVTTNDIHGEWSEPIIVDQDGIDPSLYFEDGKAYFMSNGTADDGTGGVIQCEIDINTGEKLTPSRCLWQGSGGRFLESPHLYKIGSYYYLMAAEGGTEYGHMITYARSSSLWGTFEGYSGNPVLTNRNKGGFRLQGMGHGDLIQKPDTGEWFILHLGFRQIGDWEAYHHIGRETFLTPVNFRKDGWFTAGNDGTTEAEYEIQGDFTQNRPTSFGFADRDKWIKLRNTDLSDCTFTDSAFTLKSNSDDISQLEPAFIGIRQTGMTGVFSVNVSVSGDSGEAGVSVYMDEKHHYDLTVRKCGSNCEAVLSLHIGDAEYTRNTLEIPGNSAVLSIDFDSHAYSFSANGTSFGFAQTRYVSTEVAGGFTGVLFGLYAVGNDLTGEFSGLDNHYTEL